MVLGTRNQRRIWRASGPRKENDELNPLTAYARSKIEAEKGIADLANDNFVVINPLIEIFTISASKGVNTQ